MTKSKCQIIITGVYRTGSEYFSHIINCHPEVTVSLYGVNALRFVYHKYSPINKKKNYLNALDDLEKRLKERYNLHLQKAKIITEFEKVKKLTYGIFYDIIMCSLYLNDFVNIWAEKNQLLWREIPDFLNSMPNGKAILIIRDPRSVLLSFKKFTYAPSPAYLGAIFNCLDAMQYALKYQDLLSNDSFMVVRYEDLARNPEKIAQKVWKFIGLTGIYDVRDHSKWCNPKGQPWQSNSSFQSKAKVEKFDVEMSINLWKSSLCIEEIALTELICGKLMTVFGYDLSQSLNIDENIDQLFANDQTLSAYYDKWLCTGEGIEAFPTDPLQKKNWRDVNQRKYEEEK